MNSVRAVSPDALKGMGVLLSITVARASSCRFCQPVCVSQKKEADLIGGFFCMVAFICYLVGIASNTATK